MKTVDDIPVSQEEKIRFLEEENGKLRETIRFIAKELLRERNELIEKMNYILILDRQDFEEKG